MLRTVLQSIPIYQLSRLETPKICCNDMAKTFKNILWQGSQQACKWALLSWDKLTKIKRTGGLGLRDPYLINQVMGANLW